MLVSVKTWAGAQELQKQGFEFRSMTYWVGYPNTVTYNLRKIGYIRVAALPGVMQN